MKSEEQNATEMTVILKEKINGLLLAQTRVFFSLRNHHFRGKERRCLGNGGTSKTPYLPIPQSISLLLLFID